MEKMFLAQQIEGESYNVFTGTEEECEAEKIRFIASGANVEDFFISLNQFD